MRVLTVNAGSSSVKTRLLEQDPSQAWGWRRVAEHDRLEDALAGDPPDATAHRVVHGGPTVLVPAMVTAAVLAHLDAATALAPLHQPATLAALRRVAAAWPQVPAVVCPDTAFHATLPPAARTPAVPPEWVERFGLRRYGFHGLSVAWVTRVVTRRYPTAKRLVVAHLGSGASLTAVDDGRSVDTTMGMTPLDGLVMATRSGALDPGMVLHLLRAGLSLDEVEQSLSTRSGLLGLTGDQDMRQVLARADAGDARAGDGYAVYAHRLAAALGAMVAALGGLDVLALTGGVGEGSARVRASAAGALAFLGVRLDVAANEALGSLGEVDTEDLVDLTAPGSTARVVVVGAREDLEIADQCAAVLTGRGLGAGHPRGASSTR